MTGEMYDVSKVAHAELTVLQQLVPAYVKLAAGFYELRTWLQFGMIHEELLHGDMHAKSKW